MLEKNSLPDDDDVTRVKSADAESESESTIAPLARNDDVTLISTFNEQSASIMHTALATDATAIATTLDTNATLVSRPFARNTDAELTIGSVLKDTFEIVSILGEGGMGTVFKAKNRVWEEVEARDPYVALKVLKAELSENKQLVRSLFSDFDRTKTLANCPNIIKVYGFDRDGPHVYMTMEYLTGKTLSDKIVRGQDMNITQAWSIIEGIGHALAYAHEHNIVHRDIKPGNVIITDNDEVKVLDFGIASKINESEGDETKFGGHMLGGLTVAYASPEMQRDYPPDARDDIYALACVIYEILTGQQFYKQKIQKVNYIHGLNSRQLEALNKALAFEREQRTSTVKELLEKLRPIKKPLGLYIGIGSGAVITAAAAAWWLTATPVPPPTPPVDVEKTAQKQATQNTEKAAQELKAKQDAEKAVQEAKLKAEQEEKLKADAEKAALPAELSHQGTSSDNVVQIETTKPNYKNGEAFQLSFKLNQPRYVRVIDRDADGQESLLRPNPRQLDEQLPANKAFLFPPEGVDVPVSGRVGSKSTVTIVTSASAFPKNITILNSDGSISEKIRQGNFSWAQIQYTLD